MDANEKIQRENDIWREICDYNLMIERRLLEIILLRTPEPEAATQPQPTLFTLEGKPGATDELSARRDRLIQDAGLRINGADPKVRVH